MSKGSRKLKVLMISSCGGHWVQLNRLAPVFSAEDLYFASTDADYSQTNPNHPFYYVPDASQTSSLWYILRQAFKTLLIVLKIRPDIIITTGAAVGFFALFFGKKIGAKTIWLDSIANIESVSMSGQKSAKYADLYITQWQDLAREGGPEFFGTVI